MRHKRPTERNYLEHIFESENTLPADADLTIHDVLPTEIPDYDVEELILGEE